MSTSSQGNQGVLANIGQSSPGVNLKVQQPFYHTMAYGPNTPPIGNGVPNGPVHDIFFPRTPAPNTPLMGNDVGGGMIEGVWDQIAWTLREFGFTPKGRAQVYQKPNTEYFDMIPYLHGFRVPDFMKFNGDDNRTTYQHIGQFLAQVNDVGITDVHKIRLFPLSLSGTGFNWFTSLALDSINTWPCLEQKFHNYFYNGKVELRLSDLTLVRQKYNESTLEYLKRFREMRNRCYNLTIGEKDLADLTFAGLASHLKEKMEGHDFVDVNQVLQRAVGHENHARDHKQHN
jgi:hypothetical protein